MLDALHKVFPTNHWFDIAFYIYLAVLFFVLLPIAQWASWRAHRPDPELDKANAEYDWQKAELKALFRSKPHA